MYINTEMKREMDLIGKSILAKNTMYDLIRDKVLEQRNNSKKLGLMRTSCIYDLMQR